MSQPRMANFVIGGTEKSGTTSVFDWLSAHPAVCSSARKETDFFRTGFTGEPAADAARYSSFFERCDASRPVRMEASPGYLGEAATVAPRMRLLVPEAKLLFILRDPIDRLYSSYHFHQGRLNLPQGLAFDDYVNRCLEYERGLRRPQELGLDEWYLKVLRFGCYADFIAIFRAHVPPAQIKVMFFEALRRDERAFMTELSGFLEIDAGLWEKFDFRKSNVTFSGRNRVLHRLAVKANAVVEPVMRRYPALKQTIVRAYKAVNQEREGYDAMPATTRQRLIGFYAPSIDALRQQSGDALPREWHYLLQEARAA